MNKVCVIAGQSGKEIVLEFKKRNIEVLLVCGKDNEAGFDIADEVYVNDLSNINEILNIMEKYSKYIFFGTGHFLAMSLAKEAQSKGFVLNFDIEKANLFKNKIRTHQYIRDLGYKTPIEHLIKDSSDDFYPSKYPVVLKSEEDSYKTELISDKAHFKRVRDLILNSKSKVIVESFIDGYEVTIPVFASNKRVFSRKDSLNMKDINKKAVSILKGFNLNREDKNFLSYKISDKTKDEISLMVEDIIKTSCFIGYPRFDIMIDNEDIYVLEINAIMVTALGGTHYGWEDVGINPAEDMIELFLENIK